MDSDRILSKAMGELTAARDWLNKADAALAAGEVRKALHAVEVAESCLQYLKDKLA